MEKRKRGYSSSSKLGGERLCETKIISKQQARSRVEERFNFKRGLFLLIVFLIGLWFVESVDAAPQIEFVSPTPSDGIETTNTSIGINVSVSTSNLSNLVFNWNGINYTIYNDSLILMYNFDNISALGENSAKVVDLSKYNNNGTIVGNAIWNATGGKYGGAYWFDGVDDYVDVGNPSILKPYFFTQSAWIKTSSASYSIILGWRGAYMLKMAEGRLRTSIFTQGTGTYQEKTSTSLINDNNWHHVAYSYDNSSCMVYGYIDGVLEITDNISSNGCMKYLIGSNHFLIGALDNTLPSVSNYFNGSIESVMIWNRSLSTQEIQEFYLLNLYKYNNTQWNLYVNQSNLLNNTYTYQAYAIDSDINQTEQREIITYSILNVTSIIPSSVVYNETGFFNITTNRNTGTCLYSLDGAANISMTNLSSTSFSISYENIPLGLHTAIFYCNASLFENDYVINIFNFTSWKFFESLSNTFVTSDGVTIYYDVFYNNSKETGNILIITDTFGANRYNNVNYSKWYSRNGYFVINLDTRGKGQSNGTHDVNGYECKDMYEAIQDAIVKFPLYINNSLKFIVGNSGAGGRTMACIGKYPDYYSAAANFFGISNYSLWYNNLSTAANYKTLMEGWIGGTPVTNPEGYSSRSGITLARNVQTPIIVQHSPTDGTIQIEQSDRYNLTMVSFGKTISYLKSGLPHGFDFVDETYKNNVINFFNNYSNNRVINKNDTFIIAGYLITKNYSIEFTNVSSVGNVTYNLDSLYYQNYTITTTTYNGTINLTLNNLVSNHLYSLKVNDITTSNSLLTNSVGTLSIEQEIQNNTPTVFEISYYIPVSSPSTETPSSTGGGGYPIFALTTEQIEKGIEKILYKNWGVSFNLGNESHLLKVNNISNNSATITISSLPITLILFLGEEKKVNLNNDIYYDIYVKLNSISDNKANLTIKSIHEEIPAGKEEVKKEEAIEVKGEFEWWTLGLALVIVGVVVVLVSKGKKR